MPTKPFPILSRHTPSPGSLRHYLALLDKGTTSFNPDGVIKDFYRSCVEPRSNPLRVKADYTPAATMVFPDSTIYGEIEPNLLLQTELLTAHYLILTCQQRQLVELRLVHGLEWGEVARRMRKGERWVQHLFTIALAKLRAYVFYEEGQTWELPSRDPLLKDLPQAS
jgi:hypothetical protein